MSTKDMNKALREAAVLRNLIETCLIAAPDPMTGRELIDWPSVKEFIGGNLAAYSRLSTQLQQMVKRRVIEKIGKGPTTTYRWINKRDRPAPQQQQQDTADLRLRIDRTANTLTFNFKGINITIEVAGEPQ